MAKAAVCTGTLGICQKNHGKIDVNCRFLYVNLLQENTLVYIKQNVKGKDDNKIDITTIKLASKRNDGWMNIHMYSIMEVNAFTLLYSLKFTGE